MARGALPVVEESVTGASAMAGQREKMSEEGPT